MPELRRTNDSLREGFQNARTVVSEIRKTNETAQSTLNTYNQLGPLLEITTALDPHLITAYQFGATFLAPAPPNGAGEPERAIKLMNFGIEHNPSDWHFYQNLGFVYYTELHDYAKAADAFARGASLPDAHPSMRILAASARSTARTGRRDRTRVTAFFSAKEMCRGRRSLPRPRPKAASNFT